MLLNLAQVDHLSRLRLPVEGPSMPALSSRRAGKGAALEQVRAAAVLRLAEASDIPGLVIARQDLVLSPGPGTAAHWWASWLPARRRTEFDGGPKDGMLLDLPCLREQIEFVVMAPDWKFAAEEGRPIPKISYEYRLAGYWSDRGCYCHRYEEKQDLRRP